jgi:hypothetical protein
MMSHIAWNLLFGVSALNPYSSQIVGTRNNFDLESGKGKGKKCSPPPKEEEA